MQVETIRTIQDMLNREIDKCKILTSQTKDDELLKYQDKLEYTLKDFTEGFIDDNN